MPTESFSFLEFENINSYNSNYYLYWGYSMKMDQHLLFHNFSNLIMDVVFNQYSALLQTFMQPFQSTFSECFTEEQRNSSSLLALAKKYDIKDDTIICPLSFPDLVTAIKDHVSNNSLLGHDASVSGGHLKKALTYDGFLSQYTKNDLIILNMFDTQMYYDYILSFFPGVKEVLPIHLIIFHAVFINKNLIPVCDSQEKVRFFFNPNQKSRSILSRQNNIKEYNSLTSTNPFYKKFHLYYITFLHEQSRKEIEYIQRDVTNRFTTLRKITTAYKEELESTFAKQEFKEFTNPYTWS